MSFFEFLIVMCWAVTLIALGVTMYQLGIAHGRLQERGSGSPECGMENGRVKV